MQILGFCRFSYFGISDTGREIENEDDAVRLLYADDRMATRFHLFENLTAPCIRHQSDQNFRLIVVTSDLLPAPYLRRLERIIACVPAMELLVTDNRDLARVLTPLIRQAAVRDRDATGDGRTLNFRLDDDDAVDVGYVARLRAAAQPMAAPALVSFPKGFLLFSDGTSKFGEMYKEHIAIGLARLNAPEDGRDPFRIQHRTEARRVPSYLDPRPHGFIYGTHPHNNTGVGRENSALVVRYKRNHPDLDADTVKAQTDAALALAFPFLTGDGLLAIHAGLASAVFDENASLPASLTGALRA